eukprot:7964300-Karenia_brevis.AAC.1
MFGYSTDANTDAATDAAPTPSLRPNLMPKLTQLRAGHALQPLFCSPSGLPYADRKNKQI